MQPPIYNHHRLPPAAGSAGPPAPVNPAFSRLNDILDMIKVEFETVGQDGNIWKAQRDEYETKLNQQINELGMIRQSLYELEATHAKVRQDYEAEIARLRRELEARGGAVPVSPREPEPSYPGSALNGDPTSARSPFPHGGRPISSSVERDRKEPLPLSRGPPLPHPAPLASGPPPGSPPQLLSDLDPENVSRELKKEGSDWVAVWSSQSKKQLDVSLVHSLVHETVVCCVKFSHDGKYLATGCNRTAQIYDTKTGAKTCVLLDEAATRTGDLYIRSICFSPDGKYLATGAEDRQIRIWDIKQKRIRHLLQGHMQEIYSLDFNKDGRFLVSGSGDKSARVWDIEKGVCVFDLRIEDFIHNEHGPIDAGITSVALSPDGKLVAAGSLDTMVRVWNVHTGQQVERLKGHKDSVYSVAFSPDGKCLVSGSLDRTLRVWDLSQTKRALDNAAAAPGAKEPVEKGLGTCASTLQGHKDYVLSVAISPDGQWVVSGSKDRSIQFWHIASGQAQFMLQGHKNSVISIDLAKSGGLLASGSGDCQARIWSYGPP
ncbi:general transcription repressor [Cryptotrichosporon argae]